MKLSSPQLLSYKIFQMGDLYYYVIIALQTLFVVYFLVRECKFQSPHEKLMKFVAQHLTQLAKSDSNIPIVTDEESSAIDCQAL